MLWQSGDKGPFLIVQTKTFEWKLGGFEQDVETVGVSQDTNNEGSESQRLLGESFLLDLPCKQHLDPCEGKSNRDYDWATGLCVEIKEIQIA